MKKLPNRRHFIAGLLSLAVVCTTRGAIADSTDSSAQAIDGQLGNLSPLSPDDLFQLHKDVYAHNAKLQNSLTDQLRSTQIQPEARFYAAYFLGAFRFSEGSTALVENVTLQDKNPARVNHDTDRLWIWGKYPAMEALIKIGNASLPNVIEEIALTDDPLSITLLAQVIKSVCIYPESAKAYITHAIDQELKPDRKTRLQNVLDNFDKLRVNN